MGRPDQLFKYMLELEAPLVTHDAARFDRAPEFATTELRPDGVLSTVAPERLRALPAPWCLLMRDAVLDAKMPGDHVDPASLQRCVARRELWQALRLQAEGADPDPCLCAAWVVAPHVPEWLRAWSEIGRIRLTSLAPGVWSVGPSMFPIVWIAANDLPLVEALIPFLMARSGTRLREFMRWVFGRRPPEWLMRVVQYNPEVAEMIPEFNIEQTPEQRQRIIEGLRRAVAAFPEAANELVAGGVERAFGPIEHLFARKLRRALTADEHAVLLRRLDTHGPDRIGDVVLDLDGPALEAWLHDPDAR